MSASNIVLTLLTYFSHFLLCFRFLPESPRWLLAKGRFEEALQVLEALAKVNGKVVPSYVKHRLTVRSDTLSHSDV